jgi:bifunctional non-homologous end joining protein LigD
MPFYETGVMKKSVQTLLKKGKKRPAPKSIEPMLCTLIKEPFNDDTYVYEVKWDGYRIIAYSRGNNIRLDSRGGKDYTKKYPLIAEALNKLKVDVILDGEAVVLNEEGKPDFDALQKYNGSRKPIVYYVFDVLWLDGYDLMNLTLLERKAILKELIADNAVIKFSDHFDDGINLFNHIREVGLEGIVAKKKDSAYYPNQRAKNWLKIPTEIRQEFVIGGWVESEARTFRTLLFGAYKGKKLEWVGHAGGGFKQRQMPGILKRLKSIESKECPFTNEVDYDGVAHWTKPELVANIKFATFTKSGKIRKPAIFEGFREDKQAVQVVREIAKGALSQLKVVHSNYSKPKVQTSKDSNWPELENQKISSEQDFEIDDCKIELHNVEKEIWKGITKAKLIEYYSSISAFILPHIINRPQSLHVKYKGVNVPGVYIKDMEGRQADCCDIYTTERKHKKEGKRDTIDYLVCNNRAALLYMIDLGCIDVNPWSSTTDNPNYPNYIIIDLDPSDNDFNKAIETAKAAKEYFDGYKLKSFIKTSGKTGMHILIPCSSFTFPQARAIAENICESIQKLVPEITTTEIDLNSRGNKLFVDFSQNDFADTVAAPYSVRPFKLPTVSTPLQWKEVNTKLDPHKFTMDTIQKRIGKYGDLFIDVLDKGIATKNDKILKQL